MKTQYRNARAVAEGQSSYALVHGLCRGLAVLRALNALPGGMGGVVEIARMTNLHRTTVKRLLETLKFENLVQQKDEGGPYVLGHDVRRLSEGYASEMWIDQIAAPLMRSHLQWLQWPVDLATPDDGFMIVRESTQRFSMLTQVRAAIGVRLPMLQSSLGRAWISWCSYEEKKATLALLARRNDVHGEQARDKSLVRKIVQETRRRGYSISRGEVDAYSNLTAIACPIVVASHTIGAINLVVPRSMVSDREITNRYAPRLRTLAEEISKATEASRFHE